MAPADTVATAIIRAQAGIIGSIAWHKAAKVVGIVVDEEFQVARVTGDTHTVLSALVKTYERLFGSTATEVSREAAHNHIEKLLDREVPGSLKQR